MILTRRVLPQHKAVYRNHRIVKEPCHFCRGEGEVTVVCMDRPVKERCMVCRGRGELTREA